MTVNHVPTFGRDGSIPIVIGTGGGAKAEVDLNRFGFFVEKIWRL